MSSFDYSSSDDSFTSLEFQSNPFHVNQEVFALDFNDRDLYPGKIVSIDGKHIQVYLTKMEIHQFYLDDHIFPQTSVNSEIYNQQESVRNSEISTQFNAVLPASFSTTEATYADIDAVMLAWSHRKKFCPKQSVDSTISMIDFIVGNLKYSSEPTKVRFLVDVIIVCTRIFNAFEDNILKLPFQNIFSQIRHDAHQIQLAWDNFDNLFLQPKTIKSRAVKAAFTNFQDAQIKWQVETNITFDCPTFLKQLKCYAFRGVDGLFGLSGYDGTTVYFYCDLGFHDQVSTIEHECAHKSLRFYYAGKNELRPQLISPLKNLNLKLVHPSSHIEIPVEAGDFYSSTIYARTIDYISPYCYTGAKH